MTDLAKELERFRAASDKRVRKLANRVAMILLKAGEDDGYNALVAAATLFTCDPELTKSNAIELAKGLGEHVTEEVEKGFEILSANRRKAGL